MTPAPDVSHPVQANISLVFLASMYQGPSYPCKAGFALFDRHKHHVLGEDCYDHHVREYDNVYSADVNNLEFWVWEDVNSITRAWIYFSGLYTLNSTCLPILTRKCILYWLQKVNKIDIYHNKHICDKHEMQKSSSGIYA